MDKWAGKRSERFSRGHHLPVIMSGQLEGILCMAAILVIDVSKHLNNLYLPSRYKNNRKEYVCFAIYFVFCTCNVRKSLTTRFRISINQSDQNLQNYFCLLLFTVISCFVGFSGHFLRDWLEKPQPPVKYISNAN